MLRRLSLTALFGILSVYVFGQVNFSNGLVAYYPFNGTFNDASGNGNNGLPMNGVTFGTDQWGNANNAAFFDGIDDWINLPSPNFVFGHNFSIAFRFKTTSTIHQVLVAESDYITGFGDVNFQIAFNHPTYAGGLYLGSNHYGLCATTATSGNFDDFGIVSTPTASSQWYCVVMTFNNGVKRIFVNGVLALTHNVTTGTYPTTFDSCTSANMSFRLGTWWQNDKRYFSGLMDEVRLWKRTLNQQEIDSLCNLKGAIPSVVINRYAAVTARDTGCNNSLRVDDASGFKAGDTVLMIQMKGATVDSSNTASFGTIKSYNGAGNYEQNLIKSISGNTINLLYQIKRSYDIPQGLVQLVRVPFYNNYTVSQPHTCMPWNGSKGGVFAVNVGGTLTLNDNIYATAMGFQGGIPNPLYRGTYVCNITDFYQRPNPDSSSQKGEGITTVGVAKSYGRGSLANGGGGGNAANSGGGGGGNGGAGGIGGVEYVGCSGVPATNTIAGLGGLAQTYNAMLNKAFMGGGGGAGQTNEQVNSTGGAGGGIVYVTAGNITGTGSIRSDGAAAPECSGPLPQCNNDGTGGGGGGGTLLISAGSLSSSVFLSAAGGKGANVYLTQNYVNSLGFHGPGGGGGGGVIWVSPSLASGLSNSNVGAGQSGVHPQVSSNPHGAAPGTSGQKLSSLQIVLPVDTFKSNGVNVDFTYTIISCNTVAFSPVASGGIVYNWNFGSSTSTQASPVFSFPGSGTYTVTLTVTDTNGCSSSITKTVAITQYSGSKHDTVICSGQSVTLSTVAGASSYQWTPAVGLSSTNSNMTTASPATTTTYIVAVNAGPGCTFNDTFVVNVLQVAVASFDFTPTVPIPNTPIQFSNHSTGGSYYWTFGDGATSLEINPNHLYRKKGSFTVCLSVDKGKACADSICKTVEADIHLAVGVPNAFTPNGDGTNDLLLVRGSGVETMSIRIFNRWGQKVFESNSMNQGWDGTVHGVVQDIDVFAYVLTATFIDGSSVTKTGNINLLR